jgi:hypothetical protein
VYFTKWFENMKGLIRRAETRQGQPIRFLEHVTATVSLKYTDTRGKVELTLVSPSGMTSPLLSLRLYDNVAGGRLSWTFKSRKVTDRQTINNVIYFIQMLASINTPKVQAPFGVSLL